MTKKISFGDVNKFLFFPFIAGFLKLFLDFFLEYVDKEFAKHSLINIFNESLGIFLAVIPFLIDKITNHNFEFKFGKKHYLIILCSFLYFIHKYFLVCITHFDMNNLWLIDIIFLSLFSYLILDQKIYKHQIASFIVLMVCSIVFFYFYFRTQEMIFVEFLIMVFSELVFSVAHALIKYIFDNFDDCSVWEICTYEGFLCCLIYLLLLIICSNCEIEEGSKVLQVFNHINYDGKIYLDTFGYFKEMGGFEVGMFLIRMIIRACYYLSLLFTLKYLTPSHIVIVLLSDEIYISLQEDATGDVAYIITTIILYPIIYFSIFVFTEIIELNFFGLSDYTRKNIRTRFVKEKEEDVYITLQDKKTFEENKGGNDEISVRDEEKGRN